RLNPRLVALFAPNRFTLNNWETRQQLGQKDLARWLQLWLESNAQNFATRVAFLQQAQTFPGHRHALRQARQDFPRRRSARLRRHPPQLKTGPSPQRTEIRRRKSERSPRAARMGLSRTWSLKSEVNGMKMK